VNVVLAVLVVSAGSALYRLVPLLSTRQLPVSVTRAATWAGLAVIVGLSVRVLIGHENAAVPLAPLVAAVSVLVGLGLAVQGRSVLLSVGSGAATYLLVSAGLPALV
jgi:hypothetical protein